MSVFQVPVPALRLTYPKGYFQFKTTAELEPLVGSMGQARALESLQFATDIDGGGYNIFCLGSSGLGKHQIVKQFLEEKAALKPRAGDWVYVNNFHDAESPIAIRLEAGEAKLFQKHVSQLIEDLRTTIPAFYDSESYRNRRDSLIKEFKETQDKALSDIQERAKKDQVYLLTVRGGLIFAQGDKSGNLIDDETLAKLSEEQQKEITERLLKYNEELANVMNQFPILEKQLRSQLRDFSREMISGVVHSLIKDLKAKYVLNLKISQFLNDMTIDIIENARHFRTGPEERVDFFERIHSPLKKYEVNVLVENSDVIGAPVIYEDNPTFMNLVGQIEHSSQLGALVTDFTLIKAGALHRANSGFLVLDAHKLLTSPYAWEGLKRALKSHKINIESLGQVYSLLSTVSLKPEPLPINCKVILLGDREVYNLLMAYDPDFFELFKVTCDFDSEMYRTSDNEKLFMRFLSAQVRTENLLPFDEAAAVQVLTYAVRQAADSERVSLEIDIIRNLLTEANFYAKDSNKSVVEEEHVKRAIETQFRRVSLAYEKIIEETVRGVVLMEVEGRKVGQVNGLSVFEFGNRFFGRGSRITAVARMGEGHVIDIEREIKLGGPIHSKGVLILSGYLRSHYAVDVPLSISASIVFEQSYGPVEGDSASLAELCALLSAIAQLPLRQAYAITGSVNQHGEVQAVGGINEKIEGFYDLCRRRGMSGEQGVIIPRSNVKHLNLRDDVVEAIQNNLFVVFAVDSVDDCMQLLSGVPVRVITEKIESRLRSFSEQMVKAKKGSKSAETSSLTQGEVNAHRPKIDSVER